MRFLPSKSLPLLSVTCTLSWSMVSSSSDGLTQNSVKNQFTADKSLNLWSEICYIDINSPLFQRGQGFPLTILT